MMRAPREARAAERNQRRRSEVLLGEPGSRVSRRPRLEQPFVANGGQLDSIDTASRIACAAIVRNVAIPSLGRSASDKRGQIHQTALFTCLAGQRVRGAPGDRNEGSRSRRSRWCRDARSALALADAWSVAEPLERHGAGAGSMRLSGSGCSVGGFGVGASRHFRLGFGSTPKRQRRDSVGSPTCMPRG
jgi:hypothetical protein